MLIERTGDSFFNTAFVGLHPLCVYVVMRNYVCLAESGGKVAPLGQFKCTGIKLVIAPLFLHQPIVCAAFYYAAFFQHDDFICIANG